MSTQAARDYLEKYGLADKIIEFAGSSATVQMAAQQAGVEEARIAKTLSFKTANGAILLVTAGDMKVDNAKFKAFFHEKARMLSFEEVEETIGHAVGGVCPFGVKEGVKVYLDESLRRFETVFPACGASNNAIELSPQQLEKILPDTIWVNLCKTMA